MACWWNTARGQTVGRPTKRSLQLNPRSVRQTRRSRRHHGDRRRVSRQRGRCAMPVNLLDVVATARSVRICRVGSFDPRHRSLNESIGVVADEASLDRLRESLAIDEHSLTEQICLMTPGSLDLIFTNGHDVVASVTFIWPNFLRWSSWGSDARLNRGELLVDWLTAVGWKPSE